MLPKVIHTSLAVFGLYLLSTGIAIAKDCTVWVTKEPVQSKPDYYSSLSSALSSVEERRCVTVTINVASGEYRERVLIDRPNVEIVGQGMEHTRIVNNLYAEIASDYYPSGWGTPGSATMVIRGENITIKSLTIENDFAYLKNDALKKGHKDKARASQAVALLLDKNSDRVWFEDVSLVGYQDTLFAHGGRAYIKNSVISGNVDFIFGGGQLLIEGSKIVSRRRGKTFKPGDIQGHITAPSTSIEHSYGIVFKNCELLAEEGVPEKSHTLGRPWHPTTNFPDGRYADPRAIGHALYFNTKMGKHITEDGWGSMKGTAKDGSKSLIFTPDDSRFYEWNSAGEGAHMANPERQKRKIKDPAAEIEEIERLHFMDWLAED
ncbi:pectinesterase [Alteromonadaceae bacterium Bs31]|nr:pectinesterase [Alteromonadaceae bacterium Bs31]